MCIIHAQPLEDLGRDDNSVEKLTALAPRRLRQAQVEKSQRDCDLVSKRCTTGCKPGDEASVTSARCITTD